MDLFTRFYCFCMLVTAVTGFIYNNSVPGLRFGEMTTFLNTNGSVTHMEEDRLNLGTIIFSSGNIMNSTRYGQIASVESGRPQFDSMITGFVQLQDPNEILMVDQRFQCIHLLDRRFNNVSVVYGKSGWHDSAADGYNQEARFITPIKIIRSPYHVNTVYVLSGVPNHRIRFIDISTGEVGTKSLPTIPSPTNMAIGNIPIIFASRRAIYATNDFEVQPILISGTEAKSSRFKDGTLQTAQYFVLLDIISVEDGVYIAADYSKLRVIDTVRDLVSSVCTVDYPPADGPITSCHLGHPNALLLIGSTLFIGEYYGGIKSISIRHKGFEKSTTPQTEFTKTSTTPYADTTEGSTTPYVDTTETGPTPRTKTTETKPLNIEQVTIGNDLSSVGYVYYETNFWVDNEWIRITTYTMSGVLFLMILAVIVYKVWQRNKSPSDDTAMSEMKIALNHE